MPSRTASCIRFGPFRFDSQSLELFKGDLKLKIQGQPLQILSLLLVEPGEVVNREQIRQCLWAADTFVDFEHSLNTAVRKLRQALGDEAETPKFIETLPKRGYRFIGRIETEGSSQDEPQLDGVVNHEPPRIHAVTARRLAESSQGRPGVTVPGKKPGFAWMRWATRLILAAGIVSLVSWGLKRLGSTSGHELSAVPLTTYPGWELDPDLSPDGRMVAFTWNQGDINEPAVYVKMVKGDENAVRIAPSGSVCPAWSPDGNSVAFVYSSGTQSGIYSASPLGGPIKMLTGGPPLNYDANSTRCSLSWSSNGESLLFSAAELSPHAAQAIYRLDLRDQKITQITHPPKDIFGDYAARFSPDDQNIAFARWTSVDVNEAFLLTRSTGELRQITHNNRFIRGLAWTKDGEELLVSTGVSPGRLSLWRLRLSDGVMRPVALPTSNVWQPTMARHGSQLAFTTADWATDIWEVELESQAPERKVYSSTGNDTGGTFSPDASKVTFNSDRSGYLSLWVVNRDGSAAVSIATVPGNGSPQWSPDGKWIAFDAEPTANPSLFVVGANGGGVTRLTDGKAKDVVPRWSRDGKWIYFSSNRTGVWQIFKIPRVGGEATQVTKGGGLFAQESLDGTSIYFLKPAPNASADRNVSGLWVKSLPAGSESVLKGTEKIWMRHFTVGRRGVYFLQPSKVREAAISLLQPRTGQVQLLRVLEQSIFGAPTISISPDEKTLLYTSIGYTADLILVENFR